MQIVVDIDAENLGDAQKQRLQRDAMITRSADRAAPVVTVAVDAAGFVVAIVRAAGRVWFAARVTPDPFQILGFARDRVDEFREFHDVTLPVT